jgi:membrane associated rhomboid family serine protease
MSASDDDDDLRWSLTPRMLLFLLIPGYLSFSRRKGARQQDPLEAFRQLWMTFAVAMVLYGVVIVFAVPSSVQHRAALGVIAVAIVTAVSLLAAEALCRQPLDGSDPGKLLASYRTRLFVRVAFANVITFAAFAVTFVLSQRWVYWLFLPFGLFELWRGAPTKGHLRQEQEKLYLDGSSLSLVRALRNRPARG